MTGINNSRNNNHNKDNKSGTTEDQPGVVFCPVMDQPRLPCHTQLVCRQNSVNRTLILLIILSVIYNIGGWHNNPAGLSAPTKDGNNNDDSNNCVARLDALERVWDERRSVRLNLLKDVMESGKKNIYEYLWTTKGSTKQLSSAQEEVRSKKFRFDLWEPEAVCITEERFGGTKSDVRYDAFGDGPKFVCGVDYIRELYGSSHSSSSSSVARTGQNTQLESDSLPSLSLSARPKKTQQKQQQQRGQKQQQHEPCLVYSIGSNNNIRFEQAVKKHIGCEIHTFDPTLRSEFIGSDYATFHPWGLGVDGEVIHFQQDKIDATFTAYSMDRIVQKLGHVGRKIDILKIDCEHCEYTTMPPVFDAVAAGSLQIDQILIELHREPYETLTDFFASADRAGYRITHKERNGWGCEGNGCVEYAFVRESFLRLATAAAIC